MDAVANAHTIVSLQTDIGVNVEDAAQAALMGTGWRWLLNHLYLAAQVRGGTGNARVAVSPRARPVLQGCAIPS